MISLLIYVHSTAYLFYQIFTFMELASWLLLAILLYSASAQMYDFSGSGSVQDNGKLIAIIINVIIHCTCVCTT